MAKKESTLKNMLVALFLIALVSGGVLGLVYNVTAEPIAAAKKAKQEKAVQEVLPAFSKIENKTFKSALEDAELNFFMAYNEGGELVGAAVETFTDKGFGGNVNLMVGILPNGTVNSVSVLSHSETPGLGAKMTEPSFKNQFNGMETQHGTLKVKKDGGTVDAITAATISSRAFCDAVNRAVKTFENNKGGF